MQLAFNQPLLRPVPRGIDDAEHLGRFRSKMEVAENWEVVIDGETFVVPRGFPIDGYSIPRILWPLFPPFYGPGFAASVFHDYCYAELCDRVSKAWADRVFREMMIVGGAARPIAWMFWAGVRLNITGGCW